MPPQPESDLAELQPPGLHRRTLLWFYRLRRADGTADGKRLGAVGGRIVGEVFIGLLQAEPNACLRQEADWTPALGHDGQSTWPTCFALPGW